MEFKWIYVFSLISFTTTQAFYHDFGHKHFHYDDYSYEDEVIDEKHEVKKAVQPPKSREEAKKVEKEPVSVKSATIAPKYEVTEIVDDIPDNRTLPPIFTNFTLTVPLNNASVFTSNNINNSDSNKTGIAVNNTIVSNSDFNKVNTTNIPNNKKNNLRKNQFSIFHIKAEYDNDKDPNIVIQNVTPSFTSFQSFKDYLNGLRKGFISGLQSIVNRDRDNIFESNNNYSDNSNSQVNIVSAPVLFWNKLLKGNSDSSSRVHKALKDKICS